MKEEVIEFKQQLFPVSDFHEVMDSWSDLLDHDKAARRLSSENEHHSFNFSYRLLSNDVLILHQDTRCFSRHRMELIPRDDDKFYSLKCLVNQNMPARIIDGDRYYDLHQGAVAFFNNYAQYTTELPKGYQEENIQIIISHQFIEEYVDLQQVKNPLLHSIIEEKEPNIFVIPKVSSPIKKSLKQLSDNLQHTTSETPKLHLLNDISRILDLLMRMPLPQNGSAPVLESLTENTAQQVAAYLDERLDLPFPGMEFLASHFGISVSGLKRHFKAEFQTTPFRYYRKQQMQRARQKLKETDNTVAKIAFQLGFDNPSNFIRAFKAEFDITPGQYQEKQCTGS